MDGISLKNDGSVLAVFIITFIGDILTSLLLKNNYNFSWVFKAILTVFIIASLLKDHKSNLSFILIAYIVLLVGVIFNYQDDIIHKTALFFEYYSGILLFMFFVKHKRTKLMEYALTLIFLFYILNILTAVIFEINYFKTYGRSDRFGYIPLFSSQNEFSYIAICFVSFFYKKLTLFKTKLNYIFFIVSLIAAGCVGTKVIYLFIVVLLNYILYRNLGTIKYFYFVFVFGSINLYFHDLWAKFLNKYFKTLVRVHEDKGFFDALSSLRLSYLEDRLMCQFSNFEFFNYLFGGSVLSCITEMSLTDLLLFFGVIGFIWYFYLLNRLILKHLKLDSFGYLFIISITILSFVGGYYFENFSPQLYAISFLYLFYYKSHVLSKSKALVK